MEFLDKAGIDILELHYVILLNTDELAIPYFITS